MIYFKGQFHCCHVQELMIAQGSGLARRLLGKHSHREVIKSSFLHHCLTVTGIAFTICYKKMIVRVHIYIRTAITLAITCTERSTLF